LVFPSTAGAFNASLMISIENGPTVLVPSHELVRPLRGLDLNGVPVVNNSFNEVQIFHQPAPEDGPVLGKALLSQLYVFCDLESMTFTLSKQNLDVGTPLPKSSASCPAQPALSPTDKGLIALGVVLGVLVLGLVAYGAYKRARPPSKRLPSEEIALRNANSGAAGDEPQVPPVTKRRESVVRPRRLGKGGEGVPR